jgi:hypothetical protein
MLPLASKSGAFPEHYHHRHPPGQPQRMVGPTATPDSYYFRSGQGAGGIIAAKSTSAAIDL